MMRILKSPVPTALVFSTLETVLAELLAANQLQRDWIIKCETSKIGPQSVLEQRAVIYAGYREGRLIVPDMKFGIVLEPLLCGEKIWTRRVDFSFDRHVSYHHVRGEIRESRDTPSRWPIIGDRLYIPDTKKIIAKTIGVLDASGSPILSFT
jgi:hypothetical protein